MRSEQSNNLWEDITLSDIYRLKEDVAWKAVRAFYVVALHDLIEQLCEHEDSRFLDGQIVMVRRFLSILEILETKIKEKEHVTSTGEGRNTE